MMEGDAATAISYQPRNLDPNRLRIDIRISDMTYLNFEIANARRYVMIAH
ncbi:MAG: hypothetical protein AB8B63_13750 [Granulosicoccus sp.]